MTAALWIAAIALIWLVSGAIAAGFLFAFVQREYKTIRRTEFYADIRLALITFACGIISLLAVITEARCRAHGWLWPWSDKAKREAGL